MKHLLKNIIHFAANHKKYILIMVIVLLAATYIFKPFGIFSSQNIPSNQKLEIVKRGNLSNTITASGDVRAENVANLAFLAAGKVNWVGIKEGDSVLTGQSLATLDQTEYRQVISKAEASLWSAQSAVDKTLDDIRLNRFTADEKGETQAQKATREQSQAARDAAFQDLQKARKQLDLTILTAPFDGIITEIKGIVPGQNITAASGGSMTLVGDGALKFVANVDEIDFINMKNGLEGEIILDAYPNSTFSGVITRIGRSAVKTAAGGSIVPVEMTLPADSRLIHGLNGEVTFNITSKENILVVSRTAVHKEGDKRYVYVMENNKLDKRDIEIGDSLGGMTEIKSGLNEGDKVILGDVKL